MPIILTPNSILPFPPSCSLPIIQVLDRILCLACRQHGFTTLDAACDTCKVSRAAARVGVSGGKTNQADSKPDPASNMRVHA